MFAPLGKVCLEDIIYPQMHTPGYNSCIPVATTSDIVLDYHIEFPRFNQPQNKASMTLYIMQCPTSHRSSLKITRLKSRLCKSNTFSDIKKTFFKKTSQKSKKTCGSTIKYNFVFCYMTNYMGFHTTNAVSGYNCTTNQHYVEYSKIIFYAQ